MKLDKKEFSSLSLILYLSITILACLLRLYNIEGMSPFFDETGNILVSNYPPSRFMLNSNAQGRLLLNYLYTPVSLLPFEPVTSARLITSLFSIASFFIFSYLCLVLGGTKAALIGGLLWASSPILIFSDRMALQDPVSTFFLLSALAFLILHYREGKYIKYRKKKIFLLLAGLCIGLAVCNKISAIIAFPAILVIIYFIKSRFNKKFLSIETFVEFLIVTAASIFIFLILVENLKTFGSALFSLDHVPIFLKDKQSNTTHSLINVINLRLKDQFTWLQSFHSIGYAILLILSLSYTTLKRKFKISLLGFTYLSYYLLNSIAYSSKIYIRYTHTDFIIGFLFLSLVLSKLKGKILIPFLAVSCWILSFWALRDFEIITDIKNAKLPLYKLEVSKGYFGGSGLKELDYVVKKEADKPIVIFGCNYFCSGFYFLKTKSLFDPSFEIVPLEIKSKYTLPYIYSYYEHYSKKNITPYFLFEPNTQHNKYNRPDFLEKMGIELEQIARIQRDTEKTFFIFEKIKNFSEASKQNIMQEIKPKRGLYYDGWLPPKVKFSKQNDLENGIFTIEGTLAKGLEKSKNSIEILVNNKKVFQNTFKSLGENFKIEIPLPKGKYNLEIICQDWKMIKLFTDNINDSRLVVAKINTFASKSKDKK